jgi:F-type H+-transporting ATPase subunit b
MGIDWFTAFAQLINFVVLVWLLKKVFYRPLLAAIDDREKRLSDELASAQTSKIEAERMCADYEHKKNEVEEQSVEILRVARLRADEERKSLEEKARKDADELRVQFQKNLLLEEKQIASQIAEQTQAEVMALSRKLLLLLADENLENRILKQFLKRLQSIGDDERSRLKNSIASFSGNCLLRSSFELSQEQKSQVEVAVSQLQLSGERLVFEVAPELLSGVDLRAGGLTYSWNASDFFVLHEEKLSERIHGN